MADSIMAAMAELTKQRASEEQPAAGVEDEQHGNSPDVTADDETPATEALLPAENEDVVAEDAGTEGDTATADEPEADNLLDRDVPVVLDGKTETMKLKDVIAGYQKDAVITRKGQKLAEERKAFDSEREAVTKERAVYGQLLTQLNARLKESAPQPPDDNLYHADPVAWVRQKELWRDHQEQQRAVEAERQRLTELQTVEQTAAIKQHVANEREKLLAAMPSWRDEAKWNAARDQVVAYGSKLGFTRDELLGATDHRAILALWKARAYDELMAKKPQPAAPSPGPTLRPGAPPPPKAMGAKTSQEAALQRLKKTGSVEDAMTLLRTRRS